jgi:glycosyltransferase involved in cell wall biosynthesis
MNVLTFLGAALLLLLTYKVYKFQKKLKYLKDVKYSDDRKWPLVSLVIPACNEFDTIGPALESLLKLNYPNYEIIAINDRSTDGTGDVIKKLSLEDSRLKLVTVEQLPAGWLGKVHALHLGLQMAQGQWVLFSDADVHYSPDSLKKAIAYCEERGFDFLAVSPELVANSILLKAFLCQFLHQGSFALNIDRVENAQYPEAIGIGAFNLVRHDLIKKIGGFQSIKLDVLDDGAIAWAIKRAGGKNTFLSGIGELKIEWYKSLTALIRGLEKNGFALFSYSLKYVLVMCTLTWIGFALAFVVPFFSTSQLVVNFYTLSLIIYLMMSGLSLKVGLKMPAPYALTLPITLIFTPLIILRSAILNIRAQGISWRGTFYPLPLIRREQKLKIIDMVLGQ